MLSWDEFNEEDTTTTAPAPAAAQPAGQTAAKLDNEAAGSVEEARAVAASDSPAPSARWTTWTSRKASTNWKANRPAYASTRSA